MAPMECQYACQEARRGVQSTLSRFQLGRRKARYLTARFLTPPVEHRTCGFHRIRRSTWGPSPCITWSLCFHFTGLHRRSSMFDPISPTYPRPMARAQLARSLGTLFATDLCTPYCPRLGAFAFSPPPGVRGSPTFRLLRPIAFSQNIRTCFIMVT
jgi:hypothetical protein